MHPGDRYISDGNPATLTIPANKRDRLRTDLPQEPANHRILILCPTPVAELVPADLGHPPSWSPDQYLTERTA